jgi:hypothetical protein
MATATGNAASYTPVAGDTFILRGCDDWGNSNFPITWSWSGSSGKLITVGGTDQTWYNTSSCSAWNRPIFDGGGSPLSGSSNTFISMGGNGYVEWTWIEHKGHNWTSATSTGYQANACLTTGGSGVIIDHWYVHGWTHTGGATSDSFQCFSGSTSSPYNNGSILQYNVFDGTDSTNGGDSGMFMYVWPNAEYNVVNNATEGIYGTLGNNGNTIAYNRIGNINQSFDATVHENAVETLIGTGNNGNFYIHDNVIGPVWPGESMFLGNTGEVDYVWNNLIYLPWNPVHNSQGAAQYFYNNTFVPSNNTNPVPGRGNTGCFIYASGGTWTTLVYENNLCVTDSGTGETGGFFTAGSGIGSPTATNFTYTDNVVISSAAAVASGISSESTYLFQPQSLTCNGIPTNCPIGAWLNLAAAATGALATLQDDTSYACTESTVSGVVQPVCPSRAANSRPAAGAGSWDVGAYFGATTAPAPPTNLTVVVQ